MKNLAYVFVLFLFLSGCKVDDYSPFTYANEATIYSDSKTTLFREFVIIIDPYILLNNEKKYIVCDTIKNVVIRLDNKPWGIYNSFAIDTAIFPKLETSNLYVTNSVIKYSFIAPYLNSSDTLFTAGDYSDLLNNYLTLEPGNYILQIISFDIKQSDGTLRKIKPFIVIPIEVKENSRNAFAGEFEVQINN